MSKHLLSLLALTIACQSPSPSPETPTALPTQQLAPPGDGFCDVGETTADPDCDGVCGTGDHQDSPDCLGSCDGIGDADRDGTCDNVDVCPGGIDRFDADGDGTPDDCDDCGNGTLDAGEACDDGNVGNYDGCSAACVVEVDSDGDGLVDGLETDVLGTDPGTPDDFDCPGSGSPLEDELFSDGDTVIYGDTRNSAFGRSVANIGDFNGDGIDDLAIGASGDRTNGLGAGAVYVYFGPPGNGDLSPDDADAVYVGDFKQRAGFTVAAAGDVDGDGRGDMIVGSLSTGQSSTPGGAAWLVLGTTSAAGQLDLDTEAIATFEGQNPGDEFGGWVAGVGDVDGDGNDDIAIGAPFNDTTAFNAGATYIYTTPPNGTLTYADADVTIHGSLLRSESGIAISGIGDFNGDSIDDFAIGAPIDTTAGSRAGATYVFYGSPTLSSLGTTTLTSADVIITGDVYDRLGASVAFAGDVNGDGLGDFWIGAKNWGASRRGAAFLILGDAAVAGPYNINDIYTSRIRGFDAADIMGNALAGNFDANNDGHLDVVLAAHHGDSETTRDTGGVWVMLGPFTDNLTLSSSGRKSGINRGAYAGSSVATFPDLNGDGYGDLIAGSWRANTTANRAGMAALFEGGIAADPGKLWYADLDGDGYGDDALVLEACIQPPGFIDNDGDCRDDDAEVHAFATEDNCSQVVDFNCDSSTGSADGDGDGVGACEGDCDDSDPDTSPNALEMCSDAIDNDCDGLVDDASAVDALGWYIDADMDGYGNQALEIIACEDPEVFAGTPINVGGDCDDITAAVNPGATEVCDGIDNDCANGIDGETAADASYWFADTDGDGHGDLQSQVRACTAPTDHVADSGDCDDSSDQIFPGAVELCDVIDNNCDGRFYSGGDQNLGSESEGVLRGSGTDKLGQTVALMDDQNGDGMAEMVFGAAGADDIATNAGAVFIRNGSSAGVDADIRTPLTAGVHEWDARFLGERPDGRFGSAIATGDFNNDGSPDIAIGAPREARPENRSGLVAVYYGPHSGDFLSADADVLLRGNAANALLGSSLDAGDINGDGIDDLLLGSPDAPGGGTRQGTMWVLLGGTPWASDSIDNVADAWLNGSGTDDSLGLAVAVLGDVNNDGMVDIAAGAPDIGALNTGAVEIVYGSGSFAGALSSSVSITGDVTGARVGRSLAAPGDANGDGIDDLLIGSAANSAWLVPGSVTLSSDLLSAVASTTFSGGFSASLGTAVSAPGDVNGDGVADLFIGGHTDRTVDYEAGVSYLVYGSANLPPTVGANDLESRGRVDDGTTFPTYSDSNLGTVEGARFFGEKADDQAGRYLAGGRDVNGDGAPDLVIGAPAADNDAGKIWMVYGGGYGLDIEGTGSAYATSVTIDGEDDWPSSTTVDATSGPGAWSISWDDEFLYVATRHSDAATGTPSHFVTVYIGNDDASGGTTGQVFNTQQPGLPTPFDHVLVWRGDDGYNSWQTWNGSGWTPQDSWLGTNGSSYAHSAANALVEFAIPLSEIGDPTTVNVLGSWLFEGAGFESTYAAFPADSISEGYDPDPSTWYSFDLTGGYGASAYTSSPAGGAPALADDMTRYYADADGDGQADETQPAGFLSCPMHVPQDLDGTPSVLAVLDPVLATDCDDNDPSIYAGAPEAPGEDGVDSNCDGIDGGTGVPAGVRIGVASAAGSDDNGTYKIRTSVGEPLTSLGEADNGTYKLTVGLGQTLQR